MTIKHLVGTYAGGYGLHAPTTNLTVDASAVVGGKGVYTPAAATGAYTVVNDGQIVGAAVSGYHGVYLGHGGAVTNGGGANTTALIQGYEGVAIAGGPGVVTNFGTIVGYGAAGVYLAAGGTVANGAKSDTGALISTSQYSYGVEVSGGAGTVRNFGTVTSGLDGVALNAGGLVVNGAVGDTGATLYGAADGVVVAGQPGAITNFGTISGAEGVALTAGGAVVNGSLTDTGAMIQAKYGAGVYIGGGVGTVTNFGAIKGTPTYSRVGVFLNAGGTVINGAVTDTGAYIGAFNDGSGRAATGVVIQNGSGTVDNFGVIRAGDFGVYLLDPGTVVNGSSADTSAIIVGYGFAAVYDASSATVTNFGILGSDGFEAVGSDGGVITNGSNADTIALIVSFTGFGVESRGPGNETIVNFAAIYGYQAGVYHFKGSGVTDITNGGPLDSSAAIRSARGPAVGIGGAGMVTNYGVIASQDYYGVNFRGTSSGTVVNFGTIGSGSGVRFANGGVVTNGSRADAQARIEGFRGVRIDGAAGTVANFGTVVGYGSAGVAEFAGGSVTNGSGSDSQAMIEGYRGVEIYGATGEVTNLGTIVGAVRAGVDEFAGGSVVNGSVTDTSALIQSAQVTAVGVSGASGAVTNFGTVAGYIGVFIDAGGSVTNGVAAVTTAQIQGSYAGVVLQYGAGGTLTNFGTVTGGQFGVYLNAGGTVTNGSRLDRGALISGGYGVFEVGGGVTVVNFGTIAGTGGVAIDFSSASDVLVVEAASTFVGSVLGGGGVLDLASGTGTVTTHEAAGALDAKVRGSMATTTFSDFGTIEVAAGASFGVFGDGVVGAGQSLVAAGGKLRFTQAINGAGAIVAGAGGTLEVDVSAAATLAMDFTGANARLVLGRVATFAATINGFAATDSIDLVMRKATAVSLSASDVLTVMNGSQVVATLQLSGNDAGDTFSVASDNLGGTLITTNAPGVWPAAVTTSAAASATPTTTGPAHSVFAKALGGLGDSGVSTAGSGAPATTGSAHRVFVQAMSGLGGDGTATAPPSWVPPPSSALSLATPLAHSG